MDVRKTFMVVAFSCVISACSNPTKTAQVSEALASAKCASAAAIKSKVIVEWEDDSISFEKITDVETFKKNFIEPNIAQIKRVQFDQRVQFHPTSFSNSIAVSSAPPIADWGQKIIQLDNIDIKNIGGQGIIVGVVDAFVDVTHPQLKGQIAINAGEIPNNGIDDDNNGIVDDYLGASFISQPSMAQVSEHGTHVSGIIAADPNLGQVRGIAPKAKIVPAQFISNDGSGSLSDAILALEYVASRGAKIINASWGGAPCANALSTEFKSLEKKGILLVVAAGNESSDLDMRPTYPASFNLSNQITVAASSENDFMAFFSNSSFTSVHIAAPGVGILSTVPGNGTMYMDGTSMAAPFVTGAAALIWGARPQATAQQVKLALMNSVDVTPNHEFRVQSQGRLNVYKAYLQIKAMIP